MQQRTSPPDATPANALPDSKLAGQMPSVDQAISPSVDLALVDVERPVEVGGREGPEPTRFGDWEKAGRCIDF